MGNKGSKSNTIAFRTQETWTDCFPAAVWNACSFLNLPKPSYKKLCKSCGVTKKRGTSSAREALCIETLELPFTLTTKIERALKASCSLLSFRTPSGGLHIVFSFRYKKKYFIVNYDFRRPEVVHQTTAKKLKSLFAKEKVDRRFWYYNKNAEPTMFLKEILHEYKNKLLT